MTLLLALALAATAAASDPSPSSGEVASPGAEAAPSPERVEPPPRAAPSPGKSANWESFVITESIFAGVSALSAYAPEVAGWSLAGIGLLTFVFNDFDESDPLAFFYGFTVGVTGVGLYNALELRSDRYSHSDRFWLNLAAWQAAAGCAYLSEWLFGGSRDSNAPRIAVTVGSGAGPSMLVVSGRF